MDKLELEIIDDEETFELDIPTPLYTVEFKDIGGEVEDNEKLVLYIDTHGGKIDEIYVNGVKQTITNKKVNIDVPTKTSDLDNDSNFINKTYLENNYYSKEEINELLSKTIVGGIIRQ